MFPILKMFQWEFHFCHPVHQNDTKPAGADIAEERRASKTNCNNKSAEEFRTSFSKNIFLPVLHRGPSQPCLQMHFKLPSFKKRHFPPFLQWSSLEQAFSHLRPLKSTSQEHLCKCLLESWRQSPPLWQGLSPLSSVHGSSAEKKRTCGDLFQQWHCGVVTEAFVLSFVVWNRQVIRRNSRTDCPFLELSGCHMPVTVYQVRCGGAITNADVFVPCCWVHQRRSHSAPWVLTTRFQPLPSIRALALYYRAMHMH